MNNKPKITLIWKRCIKGRIQYFCHAVEYDKKSQRVGFVKSRITKGFFEYLKSLNTVGDMTPSSVRKKMI